MAIKKNSNIKKSTSKRKVRQSSAIGNFENHPLFLKKAAIVEALIKNVKTSKVSNTKSAV